MTPRRLSVSILQLLIIPLVLFVAACIGMHKADHFSPTNAPQINLLHRGDPNLAGVIIYKDDPVNMQDDPPRQKTDHPFAIVYYFWENNGVRDVHYDKRGRIMNDTWHERYTPVSKADWARVDFSYGSDPKFKRHADPRKIENGGSQ